MFLLKGDLVLKITNSKKIKSSQNTELIELIRVEVSLFLGIFRDLSKQKQIFSEREKKEIKIKYS